MQIAQTSHHGRLTSKKVCGMAPQCPSCKILPGYVYEENPGIQRGDHAHNGIFTAKDSQILKV